MAKINLRNLSKSWVSVVGINQFNLKIGDKEFLVLLGPSGPASILTKVRDPRTFELGKWCPGAEFDALSRDHLCPGFKSNQCLSRISE